MCIAFLKHPFSAAVICCGLSLANTDPASPNDLASAWFKRVSGKVSPKGALLLQCARATL